MWDFIKKQKLFALLAMFAAFVAFCSLFSVADFSKLQVAPRPALFVSGIWLAGVAFVAAILAFVIQEGIFSGLVFSNIKSFRNGYSACLGRIEVRICFGALQDLVDDLSVGDHKHAVVLPANDFFDLECISASNTALGAFILSKVQGGSSAFWPEIEKKKKHQKVQQSVEKEEGLFEDSFGTGVCLYFDNLPGVKQSAILTSVSTKRAGAGIMSTLTDVCGGLLAVFNILNDQRICGVTLPLLGAGKGGLSPELSLNAILLSLLAAIRQRQIGAVEKFNIVVFSGQGTPEIKKSIVKKILVSVVQLHQSYK